MDALRDVCDLRHISVSTENTDHRGRPYRSDFVVIEPEHKIGFEVFHNEIIVFYFNDHRHFEDYSNDLADDGPDHVQRAIEFLRRFFTSPLRSLEKRKGKHIIRSEWFFLLPDGRKESIAGPWIERIFTNPFIRPSISLTNWHYDRSRGRFYATAENDIVTKVIEARWDILLEIHKTGDVYTYSIMQRSFDEEGMDWFWMPRDRNISFYDTEEKAIEAAKADVDTIPKQ
ncbi:MAG: hypothetical protein IJW45_00075 [Oscillospiraceae bacterium]|nr:hypothetical protein [Oscillospiraceae bacterium]